MMRHFACFWWACARTAARGSTAFANDWQWLFGFPILAGFATYIVGSQGGQLTVTSNAIVDGVIAAFAAFFMTWLVAFVVRLANAPMALYRSEKKRADALSARLIPKLEIRFVEKDPRFVADVPLSDPARTSSRWIRILPVSLTDGTVEDCRPQITRIVRLDPSGNEEMSSSGDRLPLPWAATDKSEQYLPKDVYSLASGIEQYVDMVWVRRDYSGLIFPIPDETKLNANIGLYDSPGRYIVTVAVASRNSPAASQKFLIEWDGHWDHLTVRAIE